MLTYDDVCLGAGATGSTASAGSGYTGDLSFGEVAPAPSLMTAAHVKEKMPNEQTAKDSVASTLCSTLSEAKDSDSDSKSIHAALLAAGTQFTCFTST